jgi:type IV pilus assembly protein PilB
MRIGQILLREGLIDDRQLERALSIQSRQTSYRPLGEILRELGFVSRRTFHEVLLKYRKQIRLGELLVKMGVISEDQLHEALESQGRSKKRLGQALLERQWMTPSQLIDAICLQLGIDLIDPDRVRPDRELLGKVNVAFLRRRRVMPLNYDRKNNVLAILMEDLADKDAITDLGKILKSGIEPVMLRTGAIDHLLDGLLDAWHLAP